MAKMTYQERRAVESETGLNRLAAFIPQEDYTDELIRHIAENVKQNPDGSFSKEYESMLEKSAAILSYLRNNGYDYSVRTGRSGQLEAKLSDRNMVIRLLDSDENALYCGRCYVDGRYYHYKNSDMSDKASAITYADITADDAVRLIRKAMGESVPVVDMSNNQRTETGYNVGEAKYDRSKADGRKNHDNGYTSSTKTQTWASKFLPERNYSYEYNGRTYHSKVKPALYMVVRDGRSKDDTLFFNGETGLERAETFIVDSREQAIDNYMEQLQLDAVALEAKYVAKGLTTSKPQYSDDKTVAEGQMQYYKECIKIYGNPDLSEQQQDEALGVYNSSFRKQIGDTFGNLSLKQLNPVKIAAYMDSSQSSLNNERNLMSAMKTVAANNGSYDIIGDDFETNSFKDKMIMYNGEPTIGTDGVRYPRNLNPNSEDFEQLSDFWKHIGKTVYSSVIEQGVDESSLSINVDENGIIHYEGHKFTGALAKNAQSEYPVAGNIGQVFEPDTREYNDDGSLNLKKGLIKTRFASGENYYIAPGYTAYVVPPENENDESNYIERTRVRSYTRELSDEIRWTITQNLSTSKVSGGEPVVVDEVSTLNSIYHHIYGTRFALDFEEKFEEEGKKREDVRAIIDTNLGCVRYDSHYKDDASMLAQSKAEKMANKSVNERGYNEFLDNVQTCMGVIDPEMSQGFFDPFATGTGMNQGVVRYLTADAKIDEDTGKIIKGEETYCPVMKLDYFKNADHSASDRLVMGFMNFMHMSSVKDISTVYMDLGGETQDDTVFLFKDFADDALIRGSDGNMRPLLQGDKLCQFYGNKGVIRIVDRNMDISTLEPKEIPDNATPEERATIEKLNRDNAHLKQIVEFGRENSHVDSVMSAFSAMSRFNIGMFKDAQEYALQAEAEGKRLSVTVDGKEIPGCVHYGPVIVTDMPVDEKTHLYEEEGGRKASGQLVACLAANGAYDVIASFYKNNEDAFVKMRELLIVEGIDLSETGHLRLGYQPHMLGKDKEGNPVYEKRNEFSVKDFAENPDNQAKNGFKTNVLKEQFLNTLGENGGFLKMPFPVKLATGQYTPEVLDENGNPTGEYMLPVLAGKFRSARETVDNKLIVHEYTSNYGRMCESALKYVGATNAIANGASGKDLEEAKQIIARERAAVQNEYDSMASDINERHFKGKHNSIKQELMREELDNSATLVIAGDPTCDLDEVKISRTTALAIGIDPEAEDVKSGNHKVLIYRDPCIDSGAVRFVKATVVEDRPDALGYDPNSSKIVGMLMNPSSEVSFQADNDGDSMAIINLTDEKAIADAENTLTMQANLINRGVGADGEHPLYFQNELDVAAGLYYDELNGGNLKERIEEIRVRANEADNIEDLNVRKETQNKIFEDLNDAYRDIYDNCMFKDVIRFHPTEEEIEKEGSYEVAAAKAFFSSYIPIIESGAKGSVGKLKGMVAKYYGCVIDCEEVDGKLAITKCDCLFEPEVTNADRIGSSTATHAKANLTGVAGKFLQHGMMLALNSENEEAVKAVTALTGSVTQKVMQLKHQDPATVMKTVDVVGNTAGLIWAGKKIAKDADTGMWEELKIPDPDNSKKTMSVQLTPEEWKKTFTEFWTDENGLNCAPPNPAYVNAMAEALTVTDENGKKFIRGFDHAMDTVKSKNINPLMDIAYEPGGVEKVARYAEDGVNIFEGRVSSLMANKTVRRNIAEQKKALENPDYVPNYKGLTAKDTQVGSHSKTVQDVLQTGDINAISGFLKSNIGQEINFTASDIEKAKQCKENVAVDTRHYDDLDMPSRIAVMESVATKVYNYTESDRKKKPEFSIAEHEFYDKVRNQSKTHGSFDSPAKLNEYEAQHPDAFSEMRSYESFLSKIREKATESVVDMSSSDKSLASFRSKPVDEQTRIAKSLYGKLSSGEGINRGSDEEALYLIVERQNAEINSVPKSKRNDYIESNKSRFSEYSLCMMTKCEANNVPFEKLPSVLQNSVADSYVRKTMNKSSDELTKYESELAGLVAKENEGLKKIPVIEDRIVYVENHPEEFCYRRMCSERRACFEKEQQVVADNTAKSVQSIPKDVALKIVSEKEPVTNVAVEAIEDDKKRGSGSGQEF